MSESKRETRRRAACFALSVNPRDRVRCPWQGDDFLIAFDLFPRTEVEGQPFDRHILCPTCGRREVITARKGMEYVRPYVSFRAGEADMTFAEIVAASLTARQKEQDEDCV